MVLGSLLNLAEPQHPYVCVQHNHIDFGDLLWELCDRHRHMPDVRNRLRFLYECFVYSRTMRDEVTKDYLFYFYREYLFLFYFHYVPSLVTPLW